MANKEKETAFLLIMMVITIAIILGLGLVAEIYLRSRFIIPDNIARYYPIVDGVSGAEFEMDQLEYSFRLRYNRFGFRGGDFNFGKDPGTRRMVFLGDSFTEGMGVEENERFSFLLTELLSSVSSEKPMEINLGQLATQPLQYFNNLIDIGLALHPDYVICTVYTGNDFMQGRNMKLDDEYSVNEDLETKDYFSQNNWLDIFRFVYLREMVGQVFKQQESRFQEKIDSRNYWEMYWREEIDKTFYLEKIGVVEEVFTNIISNLNSDFVAASLSGKLNPGYLISAINNRINREQNRNNLTVYSDQDYSNVLEILLEMQFLLANREIPFHVVVVPHMYEVHPVEFEKYAIDILGYEKVPESVIEAVDLRKSLVDDLEAQGVKITDMTDYLRSYGGMTYFLYDGHLNPRGHQVVSESMVKEMSSF